MSPYRTVFDNFAHIRRNGYYVDAAKEFLKYGGTSMNMVNFPDYFYTPDSHYEKLYRETIRSLIFFSSLRTVIIAEMPSI